MTRHHRPLALVTGGSAGLGRALVQALHDRGWAVVTDGRDAARLAEATRGLETVDAIPGDVADAAHRHELVEAVRRINPDHGLDLLVHNASTLGPLPMPHLRHLETDSLAAIWDTNAGAPHALTRRLVDDLTVADGILLSLSSDAAVQHYPGWGGYGAAKAALDHLTLTFGEETGVTAYVVDPGDMRHRRCTSDAEPGEDLSRPAEAGDRGPRTSSRCSTDARRAGRYRAADIGSEPDGAVALDDPPSTARRGHAPPEAPRRSPATPSASSSRAALVTSAIAPSATSPTSSHRATSSSSTPAATIAAEADATSSTHGPLVVHVATRLDDGTYVVELRTAPGRAARGARRGAGRDRQRSTGRRSRCCSPYPHDRSSPTGLGQPALARPGRAATSRRTLRRSRPAHRLRVPRPQVPADRLPDGVRTGARQRGDAQRGAALHRGGVAGGPRRAGRGSWRLSSCTPGCPRSRPARLRCRNGSGVPPDDSPPGQPDPAQPAAGRRGRHDRDPRAGDGGGPARPRASRGQRLDRPASSRRTDPARVVDGLITGWHDPEASHLMLRGVGGRAGAHAGGVRRGDGRAATSGTSSGTRALLLP